MNPLHHSSPRSARRVRRWARLSVLACSVALLLAIDAYRGGQPAASAEHGFSLRDGFLSDLGRSTLHGGGSNWSARALFVMATLAGGVALVGIALVGIAPVGTGQGRQRSSNPRVAWWIGGLSVVTAMAIVGIGMTPWDLVPTAHAIAVNTSFIGLTVLLAILAMDGAREPPLARTASFVLLFMLIAYCLILWFGPGFTTPHGIAVQSVAQKLIVAALLGWAVVLTSRPGPSR